MSNSIFRRLFSGNPSSAASSAETLPAPPAETAGAVVPGPARPGMFAGRPAGGASTGSTGATGATSGGAATPVEAVADDSWRMRAQIPRIDDASGIPVYAEVLTRPSGVYQLGAEDRRVAALLRLSETRLALCWSNRRRDRDVLTILEGRLRSAGEEITDFFEVTEAMLAVVYSKPFGLSREVIEVRTETTASETVQRAEEIIADAVRKRASDIHLEVDDYATVVRYRIDGDLMVQGMPLTHEQGLAVARALHAMAHSDSKNVTFSEREIQDARIERDLSISGSQKTRVTLRYAGGPVQGGADVVLRILVAGKSSTSHDLPGLGFSAAQIDVLHRALRTPTGVILLMGVTGSGKTTTIKHLLSAYHERTGGRRKMITIEDPVELLIPGARQASVVRSSDPKAPNPFPKYLKSAMRRDPDVIMVSEIRDRETAMLVMEAAQTGHMVFSTIHATNWAVALERMHQQWEMSLGLLGSPDLITAMVYQTLLSKLCPHCSIPFDIDRAQSEQRFFGVDYEASLEISRVTGGVYRNVRVANPEGCAKCGGAGQYGRTVAAEIMMMDEHLADLIARGHILEAKRYWREGKSCRGLLKALGPSALSHGIEKMMNGLVSPVELRDVFGSLDDEQVRSSTETAHKPMLKAVQ